MINSFPDQPSGIFFFTQKHSRELANTQQAQAGALAHVWYVPENKWLSLTPDDNLVARQDEARRGMVCFGDQSLPEHSLGLALGSRKIETLEQAYIVILAWRGKQLFKLFLFEQQQFIWDLIKTR